MLLEIQEEVEFQGIGRSKILTCSIGTIIFSRLVDCTNHSYSPTKLAYIFADKGLLEKDKEILLAVINVSVLSLT